MTPGVRHRGTAQHQHAAQNRRREEHIRRIGWAQKIWDATIPAAETLGETYLRTHRIDGPIPSSIRYSPALRHGPSDLKMPALVAGIAAPDGIIKGVYRIYLTSGGNRIAQVKNPKLTLGQCGKGAVRLGPAGSKIAVCEGVETSLRVQQDTGLTTWAALSANGVKALVLPAVVREVVFFPGRNDASKRAAQIVAKRFTAEGRTASVVVPSNDGGHEEQRLGCAP